MQRQRLRADLPDVRSDPQAVVETRGPVELAVHRLAGEKDIVRVEHACVGETAVPEQLGLGDFEQPHVGPVKNDPREVYVRPADVLFNDERCWRCVAGGGHPPGKLGPYGEARKPSIP